MAKSREAALLVIQSPAKVNLTLDVVGRRADGYHFIESVMQTVDLTDYVTLSTSPNTVAAEPSGSEIVSSATQTDATRVAVVHCVGNGVNADAVPTDETNLACRAVDALRMVAVADTLDVDASRLFDQDARGEAADLFIHIDKRIPVAAGLGGGSANAAAALIGANALWNLGLSVEQLAAVGVRLGADIPFCLIGGTAIARGIGEQLTPLPDAVPLAGVIVTPNFSVSTATVYRLYDEWNAEKPTSREKDESISRRTGEMASALSDGDVHRVASLLHNALEPVTTRLHPEVGELRDLLVHVGALGAVMCGSGPSVFGLAESQQHAVEIASRLRRPGLFVTSCRFIGTGNRIIEKGRRC